MNGPFTGKIMRALSWKQPYLQLMVHGKLETRRWSTNYRGWVLMCASKVSYDGKSLYRISSSQIHRIESALSGDKIITGYALFAGLLTGCRKMKPDDESRCFVDYYNDLWVHQYEQVVPIVPIPWLGSQGWRKLDPEFISTIQLLNNETKISDSQADHSAEEGPGSQLAFY